MAAQPQSWIAENHALVIRRATPADATVCGKICFEAFATVAQKHNFPPDFPSPEISEHVLSTMFSHPSFFCVVAEQNQENPSVATAWMRERPLLVWDPLRLTFRHTKPQQGTSTDASRDGTCSREEVRGSPSGTGGIPQSVTFTLDKKISFSGAGTACLHAGDTDSEDAAGLSRPRCREPSDLDTCNDLLCASPRARPWRRTQ